MQQRTKITLCKSHHGIVEVVNRGVAYELRFKNILMLMTSQQVYALNRCLKNINPKDWFLTPDDTFALIHLTPLCAHYMLSRQDVAELRQLLLEATAMIKVHQHLYFRMERTRTN
ncbi:MAG: DUF6686 family protein [Cyclobacteriaceae bacterium]